MWDRNIDQLLPDCALTGSWTFNLGMCPDSTKVQIGSYENSYEVVKYSIGNMVNNIIINMNGVRRVTFQVITSCYISV